jgi:hypothetical protein
LEQPLPPLSSLRVVAMSAAAVKQFLRHLAVRERVSASTPNQALNALLFFSVQVLEIDLGGLNGIWARRGRRLHSVRMPVDVRPGAGARGFRFRPSPPGRKTDAQKRHRAFLNR